MQSVNKAAGVGRYWFSFARMSFFAFLAVLSISQAYALPSRDLVSDRVGATPGQFRVDESGSATYSIPIYAPPGTAGVSPQLFLSYTSQGGLGPVGKGWGISGSSAISRCRATREHGDFFSGGYAVDGDPSPINFTDTDKFCLDGQRLVPAPVSAQACKVLSGATVRQYRTELDSFQRVCEYRFILADGPRFFTVERKDGSTSWYGDRVTTTGTATGTRTDSIIPVTATPSVFLQWAQTRFQDSTGNYIEYDYLNNPYGSSYPGEQLLYQVRYTGKVVLPGQTGSAKSTYATVRFNYSALPAADMTAAYTSGMLLYQTQKLDSVTVLNGATTVRFYSLTYAKTISGTNANMLSSVKECSDATQTTCHLPTTFDWSVARNQISVSELPTDLNIGNNDAFEEYLLGDIDGDGRQDMVWLEDGLGALGGCATEYIRVAYGSIDAAGANTFSRPSQTQICTPIQLLPTKGAGSWMLFDYNGDGKDDLFVNRDTTSSWVIYPSLGRPVSGGKVFDDATNLLSALSPSIPGSTKDNHPQLGDFNGDGLLDVIYKSASGRKVRLMTRSGGAFSWGAELTANFITSLDGDCSPGYIDCEKSSASLYRKNGSFQLLDFNGDSRSDLLTNYSKTFRSLAPGCGEEQIVQPGESSTSDASDTAPAEENLGGNCNITEIYKYLITMNVTAITSTTITFNEGSGWQTSYSYNGAVSTYQTEQRFADFNGDGLSDLLFENGANWSLKLNTGNTFVSAGSSFNPTYDDFLQIVDVNGDGRADVIYPRSDTSTFDVKYGLATGGLSSASAMPGGTALINCSNNCMGRFSYMFSDFDADGALDLFRIKWATATGGDPAQRLYSARGDNVSRFQPRDVLIRVTNGLGAKTEVAYQPLALKSAYLKDTNSRNSLNWGRGSPVQDFNSAMYVVVMARTSAPTYADASALSTQYYRYSGAKFQGGGRGFLGFREITTFDVNFGGKYLAISTQYAQNFPYIGVPLTTSRRVVTGSYSPDACYTTVTNSCYTEPGTTYTAIGGVQISSASHVWETSPTFNPALQEALHARTAGTQDEQFDLVTGVRSSKVNTALSYTTFGNISLTTVDTYTGTDNTNPISIATANTYVNDEANWRIGRMTASTVTHTRGGSSISRSTNFDYGMTGPVTGLLKSERLQSGGNWREDIRNEYDLDEYGNRIASYVCSQNISTCKTTSLNHPIWDSYNTVHRLSRVTYDPDGRYPVSTLEPFRTPGSAWDSGLATEMAISTVISRDEFGSPTQTQDINGRSSAAMSGAMGRPYWSWVPTASSQSLGSATDGVHGFKTLRRCGTGTDLVSCPSGATFREQETNTGSPTKWSYFDLLGRPVLSVSQTFNEGQLGKDFAASCQWYDSTGRSYGASTTFFLAEAALSGAPQFSFNPCVVANRDVTYTLFDVLGRPTQVVSPDGSTSTTSYNGLTTVSTNALSQTKTEVKNASGDLLSVTDHLGFVTTYGYNAAGNLTTVTRNAGRGNIVTTMGYDNLGRKISMTDPDAGSWIYNYTPAGELEDTVDSVGDSQFKRYDFRGRVVWEGTQKAANIGTGSFETSAISIYDSGSYGLGKLYSSAITGLYGGWTSTPTRDVNQSQAIAYDDMGRVQTTTTQIDGVSYTSNVVYNALGRGYKTQDPSGKWTKTEFTPRGYSIRVCNTDASDSAPGCISGNANTYIETLATDARGNVTSEKLGGSASMVTQRAYDPLTGRMTQICSGSGGSNCQIMSEQYGWDAIGNLSYQEKALYREEFSYDGLNRLTEGRFSRVGTTAYVGSARPYSLSNTYDLIGNICSKIIDGVNQNYSYAGRAGCGLGGSGGNVNSDMVSSPHQVQGANGYTYAYDLHGNQTVASHSTSSKSRSISYSIDDKAYEVTKGSDVTRFWYGLGGDRYKRVDIGVVGTKTTINVANLEIESLNGVTTTKRSVAGVLVEETKNSVTTNKYIHHDQLGSVSRVTDASGTILESMDYAAFGDRRNVIDPRNTFISASQVSNGSITLPSNQILVLYATKLGFSNHEMVDGFDIVHMNGRIYDNMIGRFLQADPILQQIDNGQNYNRYTYVWNNPLAFVDPTGNYTFGGFLRIVSTILNILAYFFPVLRPVALIVSAISVAVNGITIRQVFANAITAFIPFAQTFGQFVGSIVQAGVASALGGGKFIDGIAGALQSVALGFVTQSIAAGVMTSQTGGKMENGTGEEDKGTGKIVCAQGPTVNSEPTGIRDDVWVSDTLKKNTYISNDGIGANILYYSDSSLTPEQEQAYTKTITEGINKTYRSNFWGRLFGNKDITVQVRFTKVNTPEEASLKLGVLDVKHLTDLGMPLANAVCKVNAGGVYLKGWILVNPAGQQSTTPIHEFLHYVGLGHQANGTNSMLSYSDNRRIQYSDIERWRNAYAGTR